tara:strand:+ start:141 stop:335 length:195 start_codon:yes stop_codon:yes gene_type:complete
MGLDLAAGMAQISEDFCSKSAVWTGSGLVGGKELVLVGSWGHEGSIYESCWYYFSNMSIYSLFF